MVHAIASPGAGTFLQSLGGLEVGGNAHAVEAAATHLW